MKNKPVKNILIVSLSLLAIMLTATLLVIGFNYLVGYSTDTNNEDVATSIAAFAFAIALLLRFFFDKFSKKDKT